MGRVQITTQNKEHPMSSVLNPAISKVTKLYSANRANKIRENGSIIKYLINEQINENKTLEKNDSPNKNSKQPSSNHELGAEFKQLEEIMLTEVVIDQLIKGINALKGSIETSMLPFADVYSHMYLQKKELISKYLTSRNRPEDDRLVCFKTTSELFLLFADLRNLFVMFFRKLADSIIYIEPLIY